jgi:glutathione S-transferase
VSGSLHWTGAFDARRMGEYVVEKHLLVSIVSLLALMIYLYMGLRVGQARGKYGVAAPAVSGDPNFERAYRVQMNTLEWLPIFLVSFWLFAFAWDSDRITAAIGLVWIVGRVMYMTGYTKAPEQREVGFMIQGLTTLVLLLGALGKLIWMAVQRGV